MFARLKTFAKSVVNLLVWASLCTVSSFAFGQNMSVQWIHSPLSAPQMMALSVDGQHVVVGGNGPVQVYSVTNGAEVSLPTLDVPNYSALALSPDGKTLALSGMGSNEFIEVIQFWNIQTGRLVSTLKTEIGLYIYCLAFSPDGRCHPSDTII